jgi:hypothetical protein
MRNAVLIALLLYTLPIFDSSASAALFTGTKVTGGTKGHWTVKVGGFSPLFSPIVASVNGPAVNKKNTQSLSEAGYFLIEQTIDPCPPGCFRDPSFVLPTSVDVIIYARVVGSLSTSVDVTGIDDAAFVAASYSGPGSMTFTDERLRVAASRSINQSKSTFATLGVGRHAFTVDVNGYAFLNSSFAGDSSHAVAAVEMEAYIASGQETFDVKCIPEPSCCAVVSLGAFLVARARSRRKKPISKVPSGFSG